ncbi:MAG TPA: glycoside hydrolase 43 family protein, partial [Devosiaceae bacterium]|nr:glycoside hydrolase 43 family protein [Devosiaceae bacterium]
WLWLRSGTNVPALHVEVPGAFDEAKYWAEQRYAFAPDKPLHKDFQWLRTPEPERIFSLGAAPGKLRLYGRESIGSWFEQALVARRQTHFSYDAEVTLDFSPVDERQFAGLTCYYSRYNFHYLTVTAHSDGQRELLIMSSEASHPDGTLRFQVPVQIPNEGSVRLAVSIRGPALQFHYALGDGALQPVGEVLDASLLSDECGGHAEHGSFTGAFVGMAASDLNGTARPADFWNFVYRPMRDITDRYEV